MPDAHTISPPPRVLASPNSLAAAAQTPIAMLVGLMSEAADQAERAEVEAMRLDKIDDPSSGCEASWLHDARTQRYEQSERVRQVLMCERPANMHDALIVLTSATASFDADVLDCVDRNPDDHPTMPDREWVKAIAIALENLTAFLSTQVEQPVPKVTQQSINIDVRRAERRSMAA